MLLNNEMPAKLNGYNWLNNSWLLNPHYRRQIYRFVTVAPTYATELQLYSHS